MSVGNKGLGKKKINPKWKTREWVWGKDEERGLKFYIE